MAPRKRITVNSIDTDDLKWVLNRLDSLHSRSKLRGLEHTRRAVRRVSTQDKARYIKIKPLADIEFNTHGMAKVYRGRNSTEEEIRVYNNWGYKTTARKDSEYIAFLFDDEIDEAEPDPVQKLGRWVITDLYPELLIGRTQADAVPMDIVDVQVTNNLTLRARWGFFIERKLTRYARVVIAPINFDDSVVSPVNPPDVWTIIQADCRHLTVIQPTTTAYYCLAPVEGEYIELVEINLIGDFSIHVSFSKIDGNSFIIGDSDANRITIVDDTTVTVLVNGFAASFVVPALGDDWHFLHVTRKNGDVRVFIDGVESISGASNIPGLFKISRLAGADGRTFYGRLFDVRLWTYALSGIHISGLVFDPVNFSNNPIRWWRCNEDSGATIIERVVDDNGTIISEDPDAWRSSEDVPYGWSEDSD